MQLDDASRLAIEAYKSSVTPPVASHEANWEALAKRALSAAETPAWAYDDDIMPARRHRAPHWLLAGAAAIAAAVIASVWVDGGLLGPQRPVGSAASASFESFGETASPTPALPGETREEFIAPTPPESDASTSEVDVVDEDAVEERAEPKSEQRRSPRRSSVIRSPETSSPALAAASESNEDPLAGLRAESVLIGRARAALRDDDAAVALRLLHDHARRFPSGELEQERELLRVMALCEAEQPEAAARAAGDFRRAYTDSPLLSHFDSACVADR
jgi:hypothetical protein